MFGAQNKLSMDKEKYKQRLRDLVEKLRTQDPELFTYLQQEVNAIGDDSLSISRINMIEKYLGLDYKLDKVDPTSITFSELDYSFVPDDALRDQLLSDFREMMRYRYGTRSHKVDFCEYCKYAHFQLETLTNYYLYEWSKSEEGQIDIEVVKRNIYDNWPKGWDKPTFPEKVKSIDDIDYNTKVMAVLNKLQLSSTQIYKGKSYIYVAELVKNIRLTRNRYSHRGIGQDSNEKLEKWISSSPFDDIIKFLVLYSGAIMKHKI